MSKSFEEEYKKLAFDEIPDLWDRIEAGISEKSTPDISKEKSSTKKGIVVLLRKYTGAVAAAACAIVVIPAAIYIGRNSDKASMSEVESTKYAASEAVSEAAMEETEVEFEAAMEETATEPEMEPAEAAGTVEENAKISDEATDVAAEEAAQMECAEEDMAEKAIKLENVFVRISAEQDTKQNSEDAAEGQRYEATVVDDPSGQFDKGEGLVILVPIYSDGIVMETDKILEMDLVYDSVKDIYIMQKLH